MGNRRRRNGSTTKVKFRVRLLVKTPRTFPAFIRAESSDWLKVVLNTEFNHVYFDGERIQAGKQLKIVQHCSSETTLDSIFDSFNDTFSTK